MPGPPTRETKDKLLPRVLSETHPLNSVELLFFGRSIGVQTMRTPSGGLCGNLNDGRIRNIYRTGISVVRYIATRREEDGTLMDEGKMG